MIPYWLDRSKLICRYLIFFVHTDISTKLNDELQVTMLVLIYEKLLPTLLLFCLLERVDGLFPSLLADCKDLDVDNSHAPYQVYLPLLESDEHSPMDPFVYLSPAKRLSYLKYLLQS